MNADMRKSHQILLERIEAIRRSDIGSFIKKRLSDFSSFSGKDDEEWFSELCFCILTANSKADTALAIQSELGAGGFCRCIAQDLKACIMKHKHRFHNNKTRFIIDARSNIKIKETMQKLVKDQGQYGAREWLIGNIKGLGFKEASHFMRNVGYFDVSILDRHILRLMHEHDFITEVPRSLSKNRYLEIEKTFLGIAKQVNMSAGELDLVMWYIRTGRVLK